MKIQDVVFFIIFSFLLYKRDPRLLTITGIIFLFLSIPLFSFWVFFTAERLTWYAALFFLSSAMINLYQLRKIND